MSAVVIISLSKGFSAVVDAADWPLVAAFRWHAKVRQRADGSIRAVYAQASRWNAAEKRYETVLMHRLLAGAEPRTHVDHADGDGLNNRRRNLRIASPCENSRNRRIQPNNTSGVKGVRWVAARCKWRAEIKVNGRRVHLGNFADLDAARAAYAAASAKYHGEFGRIS